MAELKPCPFCGGEAFISKRCWSPWHASPTDYTVVCNDCKASVRHYFPKENEAIEAWNRRTTVETNIYDKAETYPNCTVQVLTNTATGETSVGWWENGGKEDA